MEYHSIQISISYLCIHFKIFCKNVSPDLILLPPGQKYPATVLQVVLALQFTQMMLTWFTSLLFTSIVYILFFSDIVISGKKWKRFKKTFAQISLVAQKTDLHKYFGGLHPPTVRNPMFAS